MCACVPVTDSPVLGCGILLVYLHVCIAHVNACLLCVNECVLKLFLETAAVESIIRSASTDIPRMPNLVSDPGGENIAEIIETDAHAEEVAFHHLFQRANCIQWGHIPL